MSGRVSPGYCTNLIAAARLRSVAVGLPKIHPKAALSHPHLPHPRLFFLRHSFLHLPWPSVPFRGQSSLLAMAAAVAVALLPLLPSPVWAQQVTSTVPGYRVGDSFHELFGLHWGFRMGGPGGGVFFDNGGFGGAAPAFGGFDPNSAARFGFARGGTNGGFFLDFIASQGSNRSIVSQSPILTLPNGGAGAFYNSTLTPFVTGWVPVVGQNPLEERLSRLRQGDRGGPRDSDAAPVVRQTADEHSDDAENEQPVPPVKREEDVAKADDAEANTGKQATRSTKVYRPESLKLGQSNREADSRVASEGGASGGGGGVGAPTSSTAAKGDLSVAEIRRRQARELAERNDEVEQLMAKGREAESQGKGGVARIYYQQASRLATGERLQELAAKLRELSRQ